MRKSYLIVFSDTFGSIDQVKNYLDSMPEVTHWRYDMSNCFYIVSESSAKELAQKLRECGEKKGRFVVTELSNNFYGWLTRESWYLIQNKKFKPK